MRRIFECLVTAIVGVLFFAGLSSAGTDGFFLGLDFHTSTIDAVEETAVADSVDAFIDKNGGGVAFFLGYGITPSFPLRLNVAVAEHQTNDPGLEFSYSSVTIEAAYLFRDGEPFRPYLLGGFGGFAVRSRKSAFDFEVSGPGIVFGAGAFYFLTDHFALDFALRGDLINWNKEKAIVTLPNGSQMIAETPVEGGGAAAKFLFGVSGWF